MREFSILQGDVIAALRRLPAESVHCCVTSPPYFGLRDYGTAQWEGGDPACDHKRDRHWPDPKNPRANSRNGHRAEAERLGGDCSKCGARRIDSQIGLEETPAEYIEHVVQVFREIRRVLRKDGTLWLNLGDIYAGSWGAQGHNRVTPANISRNQIKNHPKRASHTGSIRQAGLKPKDLMMIPARVAIALQEDGWYLRSEIVWAKPNPMPESVVDRPTKSHEFIYLLTKGERYYYDREAILEPLTTNTKENYPARAKVTGRGGQDYNAAGNRTGDRDRSGGFPPSYRWSSFTRGKTGPVHSGHMNVGQGPRYEHAGRNKRSVWTIGTEPFPGAHFATFPTALVEPCVLAGTSERGCCPDCGAPWQRVVIRTPMRIERSSRGADLGAFGRTAASGTMVEPARSVETGWRPTCRCYDQMYQALPQPRSARKRAQRAAWAARWKRVRNRPGRDDWAAAPCTVLDPFAGSGTTGVVALRHNRRFVGAELNPEYCAMARKRISSEAPLLTVEVSA